MSKEAKDVQSYQFDEKEAEKARETQFIRSCRAAFLLRVSLAVDL